METTATAPQQFALFASADHDDTVRLFARCARCGTPVAVDTTIGGPRPHQCRKPGCGGPVRGWKPIQATHHAATRCGPQCRDARGPLCVCSCGGGGHGRGWLIATDEAGE